MRLGIVGLDNSHCVIFARVLNEPRDPAHVPGARVVAAYRGGSPSFSMSRNRIDGFTREVTERYAVVLRDSIEELAAEVDAILLESTDGGQHLEQFRRMAVGKPVYVDKPFATTAADAAEMIRLARESATPLMSCSSLRYAPGLAHLLPEGERVLSCEAFGHAPILPDYPGLFWYGVHSAEVLFRFMGRGCRWVRCLPLGGVDLAVGEWSDGRVGVVRGTRFGRSEYGCVVHTDVAARCGVVTEEPQLFSALLRRVLAFFRTRIPPVDLDETFEIMAFLEAANRSKDEGGSEVDLATL